MTLPSLIPSAMPFLSPVSFLCHQKWESDKKLPAVPATTAILMLSGLLDEVVPCSQMQSLWEIVKNRRKEATSATTTSHSIDRTLNKDGKGTVEEVADAIGKSRFVEFQQGSHSKSTIIIRPVRSSDCSSSGR